MDTQKVLVQKTTCQIQVLEYANKLNEFYNRFDKHDFSEDICDLRTTLEIKIKSESESVLQVSEHEVCNEFLRLGSAKSAGPDNVTPRLLKLCAKQLAKVFTIIFNLSFKTQLIPEIWEAFLYNSSSQETCHFMHE